MIGKGSLSQLSWTSFPTPAPGHTLSDAGRLVFDQVDQDVGVKHVPHSDSRSCMGSWSECAATKQARSSSSNAFSAAIKASPRLVGAG